MLDCCAREKFFLFGQSMDKNYHGGAYMKGKLVFKDEALTYARNLVHSFYEKSNSVEEILRIAREEDFFWIGSMEQEYFVGRDKALEYFAAQRAREDVPEIRIGEEQYWANMLTNKSCVVLCRYELFVAPESGMVASEVQRSSMSFAWDTGNLELCSIHTSNPWAAVKEGEKFAETVGRANYAYVHELLAEAMFADDIELTNRQKTLLVLLAKGEKYKDMAEIMGVTNRTVQYLIDQLIVKFRVRNRAQLLARVFLHKGALKSAGIEDIIWKNKSV